MGIFERYLSVWVALCIITGVVLGVLQPDIFQLVASIEYASVNLMVALLAVGLIVGVARHNRETA